MGRLFWKFFLGFWLSLLLAGISVGGVMWLKRNAEAEAVSPAIDRRGAPYVAVAADLAERGGIDALRQYVEHIDRIGLSRLLAVDEDGRELLGRAVDAQTLTEVREWLAAGSRFGVREAETETGHVLLYVPVADEARGPRTFRRHPAHARQQTLFWLLSSGLIASLLFSGLLAWYFTRPIRTLRRACRAVAEGRLDTRVSPVMGNRRDELGELGENFDFMAGRLNQLLTAQRQLLHDVSHELRSPLARMQAAIGIAQQQPGKVPDTLVRLERETQRISDLVGELLLLSRLETDVEHQQAERIDINTLLHGLVEDARFEASQTQLAITLDSSADACVVGQRVLLQRALENVIRNAVKFSAADGEVRVSLQVEPTTQLVHVIVDDRGPGVDEQELELLFQPFYRGRQAMRREGTGLGLTIARRAVEALGGRISACRRPGGGLRVTLSLPLDQS